MRYDKRWSEFLDELMISRGIEDTLNLKNNEEIIEISYKKGFKEGEEKSKIFYLERIKNLINFLNEVKKAIEKKIEEELKEIEKKLLIFSVELIKKIISVEISQKSVEIIKSHINTIIEKYKTSSKIEVFVSPTDYELLKDLNKEEEKFVLSVDSSLSKGSFYVKMSDLNLLYNPEMIIKNIEEKLNDNKSNQ